MIRMLRWTGRLTDQQNVGRPSTFDQDTGQLPSLWAQITRLMRKVLRLTDWLLLVLACQGEGMEQKKYMTDCQPATRTTRPTD